MIVLAAMAAILKSSMEAGLILLLIMVGLKKTGFNRQKAAVYPGIVLAVILAVISVYGVDFFGDREIFEGYLSLAISVTTVGCWLWLCQKTRRIVDNELIIQEQSRISAAFIIIFATSIVILGKMIEIVMFPSSIFLMSSNLLNTEVVLKIAGVSLGLFITVIFVFIFFRMEQRITAKEFVFYSSAVVLVVFLRQVIIGLQVLFATGVLPLTTWAVKIIAPLINSYYPMFFYMLVGITVVLWSVLGRRIKKAYPDISATVNPAQKRKVLAGFNTEKRWLKALGVCLFTMILILGTNMALANRGAKIEPPTPVLAQGANIVIPLEQVSDGKLHRFSYLTSRNIETRFIVIKKGEALFGTGLDACDICGQAGYYQRGKDVICANCDVVINIPTIGFPGGCNPIPIKNRMDGSNLVINTADLDAKQEVFQE